MSICAYEYVDAFFSVFSFPFRMQTDTRVQKTQRVFPTKISFNPSHRFVRNRKDFTTFSLTWNERINGFRVFHLILVN